MSTPTVDEILERAHVVSLPMRVKFRGVTTREALLIEALLVGESSRPSLSMTRKNRPVG